jgi:hypothetical protein
MAATRNPPVAGIAPEQEDGRVMVVWARRAGLLREPASAVWNDELLGRRSLATPLVGSPAWVDTATIPLHSNTNRGDP